MRKKASLWLILEVFFAFSLIVFFLVYLIYSIYSLRDKNFLEEEVYYENLLNNLMILNKKGVLNKYLYEYNFKSIEEYIQSLYPFTNRKIYIYDNVYVPFFVVDENILDPNKRLVKFYYFFPFNVNKRSVVVLDYQFRELPTKTEFNYFVGRLSYLVTTLTNWNCTYLIIDEINFNGNDLTDQIAKILIFLDNYEIKDFEWENLGGKILIKINEKIEVGSAQNRKFLYFYFTNKSEELGKPSSLAVEVDDCLDLFFGDEAKLNVEQANLGTIYFNYLPNLPSDNNKYYFYLNFLANYHLDEFFREENVDFRAPIFYNVSRVSIPQNKEVIYGNFFSNIPEGKNIKQVILAPFYLDNIYHELNIIVYE